MVTPRDFQILLAFAEYYLLNRPQVQRLFFPEDKTGRSTRKRLGDLVGMGLLNRQTLLFSATMPKEISDLAANYLRDPKRVQAAPSGTASGLVEQELGSLCARDLDGRHVYPIVLRLRSPFEREQHRSNDRRARIPVRDVGRVPAARRVAGAAGADGLVVVPVVRHPDRRAGVRRRRGEEAERPADRI